MRTLFDFDGITKALEIGTGVAGVLSCAMSVQTFAYFRYRYFDDCYRLKTMVAFLWVCDVTQTVCMGHALYFIKTHGLAIVKSSPPKSMITLSVLSTLTGPFTQSFFINRVRVISRRLVIPLICWIILALRLVVCALISYQEFISLRRLRLHLKLEWAVGLALGMAAYVNVAITLSLCFYMKQERGRSFNKTAKLLDKLITWTMCIGILTSLITAASLICFLLLSHLTYLAIFHTTEKLSSNFFLAALNARVRLVDPKTVSSSSDRHEEPESEVCSHFTELTQITEYFGVPGASEDTRSQFHASEGARIRETWMTQD